MAITLWRPTGQAELDLVAAGGWREWPPRLPDQPIFYPVANRWYATKIAREWNVPAEGVGYVTAFDVDEQFLSRYPVQQAGGRDVLEHWVPAEELAEFNAHIVGHIRQVAEYRGPVDEDFGELPGVWRAYLTGESWFRAGWLESGAYVQLYRPSEGTAISDVFEGPEHPGIAWIGTDGGREGIAIDLRRPDSPVYLVQITSEGWSDAIVQAESVEDFIAAVEAGTLAYH
jgi:hypothetical protein